MKKMLLLVVAAMFSFVCAGSSYADLETDVAKRYSDWKKRGKFQLKVPLAYGAGNQKNAKGAPASREEVYARVLMAGDVNNDGKVTILDATIVQNYIAGEADVNEDGSVDAEDVLSLKRYVSSGGDPSGSESAAREKMPYPDMDDNGDVDGKDAIYMRNIVDGYGDVDGDGIVTETDLYMIKEYIKSKGESGKELKEDKFLGDPEVLQKVGARPKSDLPDGVSVTGEPLGKDGKVISSEEGGEE